MKFKVEVDLTGMPKEEVEISIRQLFAALQIQIWDNYKIKKGKFK